MIGAIADATTIMTAGVMTTTGGVSRRVSRARPAGRAVSSRVVRAVAH